MTISQTGLLTPSLPPNVTSTGSSNTSLPTDITGYENAVAPNAAALGTQPYQPYQGQLTAGLTPQMTAATGMAGGQSGAWQPYTGMQTGALNSVMNTVNPNNSWSSNFSNWMNPYMGNVIGGLEQASNANFSNNIMPAINSQFIGSGNYNSTGNAAALGLGAAQNQANLQGNISNALQTGYGQGLQGYLTNQSNSIYGGLGAASGYGNAGSNVYSQGWGDISNLYGIGSQNRNVGQQGLTNEQNLYNQSVQMPYTMLGAANQAMGALPWPTSVSGTSNAPLPGAQYGPNTLGQLGNLAGGLNTMGNSLFGQNGLFGSGSSSGGLNNASALFNSPNFSSLDPSQQQQIISSLTNQNSNSGWLSNAGTAIGNGLSSLGSWLGFAEGGAVERPATDVKGGLSYAC
jgi:hypothetical protein